VKLGGNEGKHMAIKQDPNVLKFSVYVTLIDSTGDCP